MLVKLLRVEQLTRENRLLLIFIRIERRDALLRRAVLLVRQSRLLEPVKLTVPRQNQRGTLTDLQVLGPDRHALPDHGLHFLIQILQIESHAVSEDIHNTLAENSRRQQMKCKLAVLIYHRMSGVAAALIAYDKVKPLGQKVDHTTLALIAPVDTNNRAITHKDTTFLWLIRLK